MQNIFCSSALHYFCRNILPTFDTWLASRSACVDIPVPQRHHEISDLRVGTSSNIDAEAIFTKHIHFAQINYDFFSSQLLLLLACTILCVQVINFDCIMRPILWADVVVLPASIKLRRRLSARPCVSMSAAILSRRPRRSGHIFLIIYFT